MEDEEAKKEYGSIEMESGSRKKGGFRASAFIFVLAGLENMGFIANMVSLVLYFLFVMYFNVPTASTTVTNLMGSAFLLALVGAFISDTYMSRLNTSLIFGCLEVMAMAMVTIQAHSKDLLPEPCGLDQASCIKGGKAVYFYASLSLLALGVGGVKGALPALGADQFNAKDPDEAKAQATFFNWLTLSSVFGGAIGVTAIVWVSMNKGWYKGFLISTVCAFVGFAVLAMGKPFYRIQRGAPSPFVRVAQVMKLAIKNRKLTLPENPDDLFEDTEKSERIVHTEQFSFLDKAAIVPKESKPEPGIVCSVTQVEEVKILTRMLPILASTILVNTCMAQLQTFSVQQGRLMDTHLGRLNVPPPSIPVIPLLFMTFLLPVYEFVFVPFARKITGHPSGITELQRVGVGLVLASISMAIAGFVEVKRRDSMVHKGQQISLFWLSFQFGIFGIADMFTLVGLLHFFYKEAPAGMKSLSTSFTWLSLSFGYFFSTVLVNVVNAITEKVTPSKHGWLYGQTLNQSNLDLFYWLLAVLSIINFGVYLWAASWYKYKKDETETDPMILNTPVSDTKPSDVKPLIMNDSATEEAPKTNEPAPAPASDAPEPPKPEENATEAKAEEEKAAT